MLRTRRWSAVDVFLETEVGACKNASFLCAWTLCSFPFLSLRPQMSPRDTTAAEPPPRLAAAAAVVAAAAVLPLPELEIRIL